MRLAAAVLGAVMVSSGGRASAQLAMEPLKDSGQNIYPAFEGWYTNSDGSYTLLVGYFNRNKKEELDVPIGPENKIEPGGPDQGQPTHFLVGRGWGTIAIKVPKDFGDKKLVWTITANGKTVAVPFGLVKGYQVEPYRDAAMGNTPPKLKFEPNGATLQGPPLPLAQAYTMTATAGEPAPITVWATDEGPTEITPAAGGGTTSPTGAAPARNPRLSVVLSMYRGPGTITFADSTPTVEKDGKSSTTATFSQPGEYFIRVEGNDSSGVGGGGFQCCWTTAYIKAIVKAATTGF
jgi:hypothetical protein